jgi:hypothetical protein
MGNNSDKAAEAEAKKAAEAEAKKAAAAEAKKAAAEAKKAPQVDEVGFRRGIAAVVPGSRPFGAVPASRMRLEEALSRVLSAKTHLDAAEAILGELEGELVTGTKTTGAEAILGEELGAFKALIGDAKEAFARLRCDEAEA